MLDGHVGIITGAATGIGLAIAKRLHEKGARVILWDINDKGLETVYSAFTDTTRVNYICVDVTDADAVEDAAKTSFDFNGKVDILVNNAGISGPILPTWEYPLIEWRRVIDINLHGVYHCCRSVIKGMLDYGYGRIVNIASIAGKEGNPGAAAYSASKAGVIGLTKSLGKELADKGILVNCITPAAVRTDIFDQITEEHIEYMLSKIPMGRLGKVEEMAALVCWLVSEECSFSTGAIFDISGGRATY